MRLSSPGIRQHSGRGVTPSCQPLLIVKGDDSTDQAVLLVRFPVGTGPIHTILGPNAMRRHLIS